MNLPQLIAIYSVIEVAMQPAETVKHFSIAPEPLEFQPGEVIFAQGEIGEVMYGILTGTIEMQVHGKTVETLEAGDVFGEGAIVQDSHTRASTAVAKTYCQLAILDQERFMFAVQNTPMFALEVMRSFSNRLRAFKRQQSN